VQWSGLNEGPAVTNAFIGEEMNRKEKKGEHDSLKGREEKKRGIGVDESPTDISSVRQIRLRAYLDIYITRRTEEG
jgi:hypothetical protein